MSEEIKVIIQEVTVTTNNEWQECISHCELPSEWQKEYDWDEDGSFFIYDDCWYSLSDFIRITPIEGDTFEGWHAQHGESAFSGKLIRVSECGDRIQIGRYYA